MKNRLLPSLMFGLLPVVVAMDAAGAVIASSSATAPDIARSLVRVAVPEDAFGTSYMMRYYNNYSTANDRWREFGQSFIVPGETTVDIEGIALRVRDSRDLSGIAKGFTLSIYVAGSNGVPTGAPVYQGSGNLPSDLKNLDYLTFTLDEAFTANAGTRYSFQLGFSASSGAAQLSFAAGGNLYDDGRSFYYANSDASDPSVMVYSSAQRDLDFAILYTPVPEGRTTALVFSSLFAAGLVAWRKRR